MRKYKHLNIKERTFLFRELRKGASLRKIGRILKRNHATLSRELKRNSFEDLGYLPDTAQYKASRRRPKHIKYPLKSHIIHKYVISKVRQFWSPEQISNRIKIDLPGQSISYESIYAYVYTKEGRREGLHGYLRLARKKRRKKQGRKAHRALIPCRTWITERPEAATKRIEMGHWEADSLMFSKQKSAILVKVDRFSRYTIATKMRRKTSKTVKDIFVNKFANLPEQLRKTVTADNGSEFVEHLKITKILNLPFYFCHPYSSWEKGTVENTNGLIRQYLPRSIDLKKLQQRQIDKIMNQLNNRPRKCLDYKTPKEVFENLRSGALQT